MKNAQQISALALEYYRAYGARTPERLEALINFVMTSYYGAPEAWDANLTMLRDDARYLASGRR